MKSNIKKIMEMQIRNYKLEDITGSKIVLNTDNLLSRKLGPKFRAFVESNIETEFTAILEEPYTMMYTLLEDDTNPKWIFHIEDLKYVNKINHNVERSDI